MARLRLFSTRAQESNLAWSYDQNHLYGDQLATNFNDVPATRGGNTSTVPLNTDQHLMVWMRVGAHATVRKLYAVINTDIAAGETLALPLFALPLVSHCPAAHVFGCSCIGTMGGSHLKRPNQWPARLVLLRLTPPLAMVSTAVLCNDIWSSGQGSVESRWHWEGMTSCLLG